MSALVGPLAMICGVLAVAGAAKIISPHPTRSALRSAGLRVGPPAVRALGLGELILAIGTIAVGGSVLPILVGLVHLGFAAFVIVLLRRPGAGSCGCFGSLDTPVSALHVGANVVSAAVAFAAAGAPGLVATLTDRPGLAAAYVLLVVSGTAAVVAALTLVPRLRPDLDAPPPAFSVRSHP